MTGKYTPLRHYLKAVPQKQKEISLSFEQIEQILSDRLPASAHEYAAWWENERGGRHIQAHAWLQAGWLVVNVDARACRVRFRRR